MGPHFKRYTGLVFIEFSKMMGMDTTAFQRRVFYSQFLKRASGQAGRLHDRGLRGETPGGTEAEGTRGRHRHKPLLCLSQASQDRAG